ncbi:hypothetical protein OE88DRAFT_1644668 [Heliocybe sulcata]|uniref:Uncharacterized protein n=1 Tax=Heliocybe sulcata TaxID=5364 RepID=A0A5C3N5I7_9AGAM|nr:hypothetical protein OE88DRAFT_1644668 [Heliocybe sulcata]
MHHRPPSRDSDPHRSPRSEQQHSLPSIHHLHPYLAPSVPYPAPELPPMAATAEPPAMQLDQGNSDSEEQGPPKKKRRRQALSCTGRSLAARARAAARPPNANGTSSSPLSPYRDKYVTRAEYDELKSRFEGMERTLVRLLPGFAASATSDTQPPYMSGAPSNAPAGPAYPPHPQYGPSEPAPEYRVHAVPVPSSSQPRRPPALPPLQPPPTHPASRPSPLSLAAITTPYNPDPSLDAWQSKNWPAQTLTTLLGERLRLSPAGPAHQPHPAQVTPRPVPREGNMPRPSGSSNPYQSPRFQPK